MSLIVFICINTEEEIDGDKMERLSITEEVGLR